MKLPKLIFGSFFIPKTQQIQLLLKNLSKITKFLLFFNKFLLTFAM